MLAVGGGTGGYVLYIKDKKFTYYYDFFGYNEYKIESSELPTGEVQLQMDFKYDGGGPGKGGTATLFVNGEKAGEGRVEKTIPGRFSMDTMDVGMDLNAPVARGEYETPYKFTGTINSVTIELKKSEHISNKARTFHMRSSLRQTVEERSELGKSLRKRAPRTSHAQWLPGSARPDPISLLEDQNKDRLDWLVPVRRGRMMASPFAFYRGGARIMAADLSITPVTGLTVQACGDAHLTNFGLFASPERALVFDLNDFDETLEGPWEWDLKRLVASFTIVARHNELDRGECRTATGRVVQSYREAMNDFAGRRTTDIWYALLNEKDFMAYADHKRTEKRAKKAIAKAKTKHSRQSLDRLTEEVDGEYRIKSEPPLLVPLRELNQKLVRVSEKLIRESYEGYARSLSPDCKVLLDNFRPVDFGLKVVGVGSVGTRCWILLLEGRDRNDPLFLQMKEATYSVLAEHLHPSPYENQGRRVVEGQRLMQTANDIFLGWTHTTETGHDFYWRQLRDWKGSADIESMHAADLYRYARLCGWTLARAHARSGDPIAIAGYLGSSDTFDQALTEFAARYADQNERDYEAFLDEIRSGRLEAASESS